MNTTPSLDVSVSGSRLACPDIPTLPWILSDGGALDIDLCPPCWEREAHIQRYEWAAKVFQECKVVDFGCGVGYGTQILAEVGKNRVLVGVDCSERAIGLANSRRGHLEFTECDGNGSDWDWVTDDHMPQTWMGTVALEVIEHLPDPEDWLRHISRLSRHLVLSTPITPTKHSNPHHLWDWHEQDVLDLVGKYFSVETVWRQMRPFHYHPCIVVMHVKSKAIA